MNDTPGFVVSGSANIDGADRNEGTCQSAIYKLCYQPKSIGSAAHSAAGGQGNEGLTE